MSRVPLDPVARETPGPATDRLAALAELFPEVVCEGRIDVDKLRALLGAAVDDRPERYAFSWAGKRDAVRILAEPSRAALVSDRDQSLDFDSTGNVVFSPPIAFTTRPATSVSSSASTMGWSWPLWTAPISGATTSSSAATAPSTTTPPPIWPCSAV